MAKRQTVAQLTKELEGTRRQLAEAGRNYSSLQTELATARAEAAKTKKLAMELDEMNEKNNKNKVKVAVLSAILGQALEDGNIIGNGDSLAQCVLTA